MNLPINPTSNIIYINTSAYSNVSTYYGTANVGSVGTGNLSSIGIFNNNIENIKSGKVLFNIIVEDDMMVCLQIYPTDDAVQEWKELPEEYIPDEDDILSLTFSLYQNILHNIFSGLTSLSSDIEVSYTINTIEYKVQLGYLLSLLGIEPYVVQD